MPGKPAWLHPGLSYAVAIVFCSDVTGSMTPIIDQVTNALRFYDRFSRRWARGWRAEGTA
jgi:hypothetical protein